MLICELLFLGMVGATSLPSALAPLPYLTSCALPLGPSLYLLGPLSSFLHFFFFFKFSVILERGKEKGREGERKRNIGLLFDLFMQSWVVSYIFPKPWCIGKMF